MDYGNQYLTYAEYVQLGGNIDEVPFNLLELRARRKIDERTLGRLKDLPSQVTEVKACIFKLIEVINSFDESKNVASESTDGYSINYGSSTTVEQEKQYNDIIRDYLLMCQLEDGTPYMYCGVV